MPLSKREAGLEAKIWALLSREESENARTALDDLDHSRWFARELRKLRWKGRYVLKTRSEREWNADLAKSARVVPLGEVPFAVAFCVTGNGCMVRLHGRDYYVWRDMDHGLIRKRVRV